MKKMKKLFAVLLTLAMVLGMSMTSFAADETTNATVKISGADGATLTYVQIVEPDSRFCKMVGKSPFLVLKKHLPVKMGNTNDSWITLLKI